MTTKSSAGESKRALRPFTEVLKMIYRAPLDLLEEVTTGMADQIFVNSCFTAGVFAQAFPLLSEP